ncbi:hypothetical protein HAX54_021014 [Datura stramonium]|uniref:Uncharacterized protein n=1 Tax=Datura stramonium TaxID=4076 RepID=A0ABS8UU26_DATST|nr:hypothetical protein [Datura stramonium]
MVGAPKMLTFRYLDKLEPYNSIGKRLRMLNLVKKAIDDTVLFQLIQKLDSVKELILHSCRYLSNIKISSSTLEVCSIVYCGLLVEATFNVPKLLSLALSEQYRLPRLSFESVSSQCRISINYDYIWHNGEQLIHFRRSLIELNDQVVDLTLPRICQGLRPATGIDHLPTPEIENLILRYSAYTPTDTYSSCDDIFWVCWPKNLTVEYKVPTSKIVEEQVPWETYQIYLERVSHEC